MPWPPCLLHLPLLVVAVDEVLEELAQDPAVLLELHFALHGAVLGPLHFLLQGLSRNNAAVSRRQASGTCSNQTV